MECGHVSANVAFYDLAFELGLANIATTSTFFAHVCKSCPQTNGFKPCSERMAQHHLVRSTFPKYSTKRVLKTFWKLMYVLPNHCYIYVGSWQLFDVRLAIILAVSYLAELRYRDLSSSRVSCVTLTTQAVGDWDPFLPAVDGLAFCSKRFYRSRNSYHVSRPKFCARGSWVCHLPVCVAHLARPLRSRLMFCLFSVRQPHRRCSSVLLPLMSRSCNPCLAIGKLSGPLFDTTLGSVSPRSSSAFCGCSLLSLNSFCSGCLQELLQPLLFFHLRQFADYVHPSSACHPLRNLSVAFLSVSLPNWADLQFCVLLLLRPSPRLLQVLPQWGHDIVLSFCLSVNSTSDAATCLLPSEASNGCVKPCLRENTHTGVTSQGTSKKEQSIFQWQPQWCSHYCTLAPVLLSLCGSSGLHYSCFSVSVGTCSLSPKRSKWSFF